MTIRTIVGEPFAIHRIASGSEREDRVADLLKTVGLDSIVMNRYPHEFSGGQRQRIGIARALALQPKVDRRRRTGICAGRFDSGADHQFAGRTSTAVWTDVPFHFACNSGHRAHFDADRRDVSGQAGRGWNQRADLRGAEASIYAGAAERRSRYRIRLRRSSG